MQHRHSEHVVHHVGHTFYEHEPECQRRCREEGQRRQTEAEGGAGGRGEPSGVGAPGGARGQCPAEDAADADERGQPAGTGGADAEPFGGDFDVGHELEPEDQLHDHGQSHQGEPTIGQAECHDAVSEHLDGREGYVGVPDRRAGR